MINKNNEKRYRLYNLLGVILLGISAGIAVQLKNIFITIGVIIIATALTIFLYIYRKKHGIVSEDERIKRIKQMAGYSTFLIFFFGFLIITWVNIFYPKIYPLEKTISIYVLASILGAIGGIMLCCYTIFYMYYKRKF